MTNDIGGNSDLHYDLEITLEEAAIGRTVEIEYSRLINCKHCNGRRGVLLYRKCQTCEGVGQTKLGTQIKVKYPAGVETGSRLRIPNMGNEGVKTGDLYVVISVLHHKIFERKGSDLYTTVFVPHAELITGTKIDVPMLDDKHAELRVPPMTPTGQRFRIKGKGMPTLYGDSRGDLYISVTELVTSSNRFWDQEFAPPTESSVNDSNKNARTLINPYGDVPRRLRVFLCHSSGDKSTVRQLCHKLTAAGLEPWLDEEKLLPGQRWRNEIPRAVRQSDLVIVCLSKASINKAGYVQREIKYALDAALEQPENTIFLIPLKLEECEVPESLSDWQWVDYFEERGYERLKRALDYRAEALGVRVGPALDSSTQFQEVPLADGPERSPNLSEEVPPVKVSTILDANGGKVLPHAIGIETLGNVFTKLIPEGTRLPHRLSELFSTATDNQTSVEIHILAGLRPLAQQNLSLGKFYLLDIPPAPRGSPQAEVTFDIDEEGLVNVSAKELTTGREQKITIRSSSEYSKEAIDRMMRDAKDNSEEDARKLEEIAIKERLDALLYQTERMFNSHTADFEEETRTRLKLTIDESRRTLKQGGASQMETSCKELEAVVQEIATLRGTGSKR